jgi:hypothetical protein
MPMPTTVLTPVRLAPAQLHDLPIASSSCGGLLAVGDQPMPTGARGGP